MRIRGLLAVGLLATLLVGCYQEPVALRTFATQRPPLTDLRPSATPTSGLTPTATAVVATPSIPPTPATPAPTATPIDLTPDTPQPTSSPSRPPTSPPTPGSSQPVAVGSPSPGCVNGWTTPTAGSAEYTEALEMMSAQMGVANAWTVSDMRYFTGPDVPWILDPHYEVVERWYVRAALVDDPSFRARWLLEKRTDLVKGISAVAPFESFGYESPDWTGFVGDGVPTSYLGLPGQWAGIPYDFVTGEGDSGQPGLPDGVIECLAAT